MIVPIYAALLALLFVGLSVRTLRLRRALRIAVGDAGNPVMLRAMRVHANFAEYVPVTVLVLYFAESAGAAPLLVHALRACLRSEPGPGRPPLPRRRHGAHHRRLDRRRGHDPGAAALLTWSLQSGVSKSPCHPTVALALALVQAGPAR